MKINVTKSSLPSYEEYCEEIKDIWESHHLTNFGPKHQKLEKQLCKLFSNNNVSIFTNGHLALEYTLASFNFPKGSEIITTPFTFVSTTNAIVRNGLTPVFCDINDKDYTIDVNKIEELITEKTVAILAVHVYGNICDVERIDEIAKKHNLKVIYDAAHAFGVSYKKTSVANFGDASMFSFHATKVFNTIEGGCVCTKEAERKKALDNIKNFGILDEERCIRIGGNAKMNEFQAAMGLCNLKYIDDCINKRRAIAQHYVKRLGNVHGIRINHQQENADSNYAYFPVVFDGYKYDRNEIKEKLAKHDIGARKYFYPLTNDFECYRDFKRGNTPIAKHISDCILCLPIYPELNIKDVDLICDIILN